MRDFSRVLRFAALALLLVGLPGRSLAQTVPAADEPKLRAEVNTFMDRYWTLFSAGNIDGLVAEIYHPFGQLDNRGHSSIAQLRERFPAARKALLSGGYGRSNMPMRNICILAPTVATVSGRGLRYLTDGKVMGVAKEGNATRISIFLNVFDVHVNRTPIPGKLSSIVYKKGAFLNAANPQASAANEQNVMVVEGTVGGKQTRIVFSQIAGLIARRILCWSKEGDTLGAGERFGLIRFGSRVDVYMPGAVEPLIGLGAKTVAGETVIADLRSQEPLRGQRVG